MHDPTRSGRRVLASVVTSLLLSWTHAGAEVVGTGVMNLQLVGNTAEMTGTIVFDDQDYNVLGVPVNLGTEVGQINVAGFAPLDETNCPGGGTFDVDMTSDTPGILSFNSAGCYACPDGGCTPGASAFVGLVSSMTGSAVGPTIPTGVTLSYVADGGTTCSAIIDNLVTCTGNFALNLFESAATPSGAGVGVNTSNSFVDPFTGNVVPLSVDLNFENVTNPGNTVVSGVSAANGLIPDDFAVEVGDYRAVYFDVTSTAEFSGAVEVCIGYADDSPEDGIVDGTDTEETTLRLLHAEDGAFVDRTTEVDTVGNRLCGLVTSFSAFVTPSVPSYCPDVPEVGCLGGESQKSSLKIKSKNGKDQIKWKWGKGADTSGALFDNPVLNAVPRYTFCVYNSADSPELLFDGTVLAAGDCFGKPCWKGSATKGFKFKNKGGNAVGLTGMKLKPGSGGKAQVQVKGKGANLTAPTLPLAGAPPAVVSQLIVDNGSGQQCWSTTYSTVKKNEDTLFQAKGE